MSTVMSLAMELQLVVKVRRRIVRATNVFFEGEIENERKTNVNIVFDLDIIIYYISTVLRIPPGSNFVLMMLL